MRFIMSSSPQPVADATAELIMARLAQGPVLWLLSGGSCIAVAVAAADRLRATGISLENLTVTLADERYGATGHADSNWTQLEAAGFHLPVAKLEPVIVPHASADASADHFATVLEQHFGKSYCIALLGIGPDSHTSGIKPHSPAVAATGYVSAYDWSDYRRITTTARALAKINEAVVYAMGESKWSILNDLETTSLDAADQPAQLLKLIPEVTVYSDRPQSAL